MKATIVPKKNKTAQTQQALTTELLERLNADLREAARRLTFGEARYMVDAYYQIQEIRKAMMNQARSLVASSEPNDVLAWLGKQMETLEDRIKKVLDSWTDSKPLGKWCKSHVGIGPVISAGLMAHIDIAKATVAGDIWRYAGLDPTQQWLGRDKAAIVAKECMELAGNDINQAITIASQKLHIQRTTIERLVTTRKKKSITPTLQTLSSALAMRPWNGQLKTLCWKLGESFVKVCNREDAFYGKLYVERKRLEWAKNLNGDLAKKADEKLDVFKIGLDADARLWYSGCFSAVSAGKIMAAEGPEREKLVKQLAGKPGSGVKMLPPGHIQARSKRHTVKIFLAHYQYVGYCMMHGKEPPKPYVIAILGHADEIKAPNYIFDPNANAQVLGGVFEHAAGCRAPDYGPCTCGAASKETAPANIDDIAKAISNGPELKDTDSDDFTDPE